METGGAFHGYRKLPNTNSAPGGGVLKSDQMKNSNSNNNSNSNSNSNGGDESECTVREQDRFMPIANVIRIMRKILPAHAKISDDAKETIQECVSEYISFITGEANERCQREQRKTITAEDVLWAMSKLGFDDYIEPLTIYLHRFRDLEGDRTSSIRQPDPLAAKRTLLDYAPPPLGAAAFVPHQFHIPHPHPNGYFGAPTYMRPAGGSSHHHQPSSLTDSNNNNNAETCNNGGQYK